MEESTAISKIMSNQVGMTQMTADQIDEVWPLRGGRDSSNGDRDCLQKL